MLTATLLAALLTSPPPPAVGAAPSAEAAPQAAPAAAAPDVTAPASASAIATPSPVDPIAHGLYVQTQVGLASVVRNARIPAAGQGRRSESLALGGDVQLGLGFELHPRWSLELAASLLNVGSRGTSRLRGLSFAAATLGLRYLHPLSPTLSLRLSPRGGIGRNDTVVEAATWGTYLALGVGFLLQPPVRHLHVGLDLLAGWALRPGRVSLIVQPSVAYTF